MEEDKDYMEEEEDRHEEEDRLEEEDQQEKRPHKGGKIIRLEPTNTKELMASLMEFSCF